MGAKKLRRNTMLALYPVREQLVGYEVSMWDGPEDATDTVQAVYISKCVSSACFVLDA